MLYKAYGIVEQLFWADVSAKTNGKDLFLTKNNNNQAEISDCPKKNAVR